MIPTILTIQLLTFLINLAFGLFVLWSNPQAKVNRVYAAFAIALAFWNLALFLTIMGGHQGAHP